MARSRQSYDVLYNPRLSVPDFPRVAERWAALSERARSAESAYFDVPYGTHEAQRIDVFRAHGASRALFMFIHGGYWRALDKRDFSFIAPAFTSQGVTVAIPNYALCPAVQVRDIVMQMVQACAWLYRNGENFGAPRKRLFVGGHSAGGHLTAMMLACRWTSYARDLPDRVVQGGLSISGLYDLRDIAKAPSINGEVRLTARSALPVSPAFLPPATGAPLIVALGAEETGGFHIQDRLIRRRWAGVIREAIACPGDNHFTVLDTLCRAGSTLHCAALRLMEEAT